MKILIVAILGVFSAIGFSQGELTPCGQEGSTKERIAGLFQQKWREQHTPRILVACNKVRRGKKKIGG